MNELVPAALGSGLQLIGSIASVGAIPLSIYLYLRSREAKFVRLRRDSVRVLSHQIGEGRKLTLFEIRAVLKSKVREAGVRGNPLPVNEVLEDLVTDTITNPMLDSDRKTQIIGNLESLHEWGLLEQFLRGQGRPPRQIEEYLSHDLEEEREEERETRRLVESYEASQSAERPRSTYADIFGILAAVTSIVGFSVALLTSERLFPAKDLAPSVTPLVGVIMGALASGIALLAARLYFRERARTKRTRRSDLDRKEDDPSQER